LPGQMVDARRQPHRETAALADGAGKAPPCGIGGNYAPGQGKPGTGSRAAHHHETPGTFTPGTAGDGPPWLGLTSVPMIMRQTDGPPISIMFWTPSRSVAPSA